MRTWRTMISGASAPRLLAALVFGTSWLGYGCGDIPGAGPLPPPEPGAADAAAAADSRRLPGSGEGPPPGISVLPGHGLPEFAPGDDLAAAIAAAAPWLADDDRFHVHEDAEFWFKPPTGRRQPKRSIE